MYAICCKKCTNLSNTHNDKCCSKVWADRISNVLSTCDRKCCTLYWKWFYFLKSVMKIVRELLNNVKIDRMTIVKDIRVKISNYVMLENRFSDPFCPKPWFVIRVAYTRNTSFTYLSSSTRNNAHLSAETNSLVKIMMLSTILSILYRSSNMTLVASSRKSLRVLWIFNIWNICIIS